MSQVLSSPIGASHRRAEGLSQYSHFFAFGRPQIIAVTLPSASRLIIITPHFRQKLFNRLNRRVPVLFNMPLTHEARRAPRRMIAVRPVSKIDFEFVDLGQDFAAVRPERVVAVAGFIKLPPPSLSLKNTRTL